jgi:hypothetical protein
MEARFRRVERGSVCVEMEEFVAAIVVAIVVYLIFAKVWDGSERILSVLGGVFSAFTGYASAFSAYVKTRWAPDQVVPTLLLRDAVATTSAQKYD